MLGETSSCCKVMPGGRVTDVVRPARLKLLPNVVAVSLLPGWPPSSPTTLSSTLHRERWTWSLNVVTSNFWYQHLINSLWESNMRFRVMNEQSRVLVNCCNLEYFTRPSHFGGFKHWASISLGFSNSTETWSPWTTVYKKKKNEWS